MILLKSNSFSLCFQPSIDIFYLKFFVKLWLPFSQKDIREYSNVLVEMVEVQIFKDFGK